MNLLLKPANRHVPDWPGIVPSRASRRAETSAVSAGSKGFSRRAVECLMANAKPERALGADAEWPIVLHRSGFRLNYVEVDGLDWESADRFRDCAADPVTQQQAALAYDAVSTNWAHRVDVAYEIVQVALDANRRPLISP